MGWLGNLLETVRRESATEWTYIDELEESGSDPSKKIAGREFTPDDCYVEVWIEGFRLDVRRSWATTFVASTYASVTLAVEGDVSATRTKLTGADKNFTIKDRDRIITPSTRVLSALPWRGGVLGIELAVFSVKTGNLAAPILKYVTKVASTAGLGLASVVDPFLPLVTEGLDLIAGSTEDTKVEIAIDIDMNLTTSGLSAVIAIPNSSVLGTITLDPTGHYLLEDGNPLEAGYCVYSIRKVATNAEWGSIQPLKKAYDAIKVAGTDGDDADVAAALQMFRRQVAFSPDLIQRDKDRILRLAQQAIDNAKATASTGLMEPPIEAKAAARTTTFFMREFGELNLYDEVTK